MATHRGLARHLEGWQPALLAVGLAACGTWLVVPRAVPPTELPRPQVAPRELQDVARRDRELARSVELRALDVDVRHLGSALLSFGRAEHQGDPEALRGARARLTKALEAALRQPLEDLLRLRAYQLELFLAEVRRYRATNLESAELAELGGSFITTMRQSGWLSPGAPAGLEIDEAALRASFKLRFARVLQLEPETPAAPRGRRVGEPGVSDVRASALALLELEPAERRAWLRFAIEHPPRGTRQATDRLTLNWVAELAELDPTYPADFARGVLHYRSGHYELALESFRRHLEAQPDGAFALRARNHLVAARARSQLVR